MSTQKNEHNPDNLTPEQVGKGFRLLQYGEVIDPMDEMYIARFGNSRWEPTGPSAPGHIIEKAHYAHRRRITPPTDTTGSGREGETPETDAFFVRLMNSYRHSFDLLASAKVFARQLERQRDAALKALSDIEAHWREQSNNPLWSQEGREICQMVADEISERRAAIDSAQRQEGR